MINNYAQYLHDPQEALRIALDGRQITMWTALPGIIQKIDFDKMTCEVQPALQAVISDETGKQSQVNLPLLLDVPLVFPSGGGFTVTFPVAVGDEVLVVFSSRCIDAWWQKGGFTNQTMEARMHDLSDGFAIPGPKSLPNVGAGINPTRVQIRNQDGTVYFSVGSKFAMTNVAADLHSLLLDLQGAVATFMTVLAAFSGGASPVTQAMLQAPAAQALIDLNAVTAEITALLE